MSSSFLILRSGGSSAVVGLPLASLGRGSSVLMRRLGWEGGGGGGASGWGAAGRRLRFFFFFGAVLVLLLDDDREAAFAPPDDPYPSQSGTEIHPSSRYTMQGRYMCHRRLVYAPLHPRPQRVENDWGFLYILPLFLLLLDLTRRLVRASAAAAEFAELGFLLRMWVRRAAPSRTPCASGRSPSSRSKSRRSPPPPP